MTSMTIEVRITTCMLSSWIPWSMMRWIRRGIVRSMMTTQTRKKSETRLRRQYGLANGSSFLMWLIVQEIVSGNYWALVHLS